MAWCLIKHRRDLHVVVLSWAQGQLYLYLSYYCYSTSQGAKTKTRRSVLRHVILLTGTIIAALPSTVNDNKQFMHSSRKQIIKQNKHNRIVPANSELLTLQQTGSKSPHAVCSHQPQHTDPLPFHSRDTTRLRPSLQAGRPASRQGEW
jgi:hypothetical protein